MSPAQSGCVLQTNRPYISGIHAHRIVKTYYIAAGANLSLRYVVYKYTNLKLTHTIGLILAAYSIDHIGTNKTQFATAVAPESN